MTVRRLSLRGGGTRRAPRRHGGEGSRASGERLPDLCPRRLRVRLHADERTVARGAREVLVLHRRGRCLLPYAEYEQAETIMSVRQKGGENVTMFNSYAPLLEKVKNLKRAQVEGELRCF